MNQRNSMRSGSFIFFPLITALQLDLPASKDVLRGSLSSFNYREVLIVLARINLLLQRSERASDAEEILQKAFCTRFVRGRIREKNLADAAIFNRQSTLRLLTESACVANPLSTHMLSTVAEMSELGSCYLIANELLQEGYAAPEADLAEERKKHLLVASIPSQEYAIYSQPLSFIGNALIRYKEFFRLLLEATSDVDVAEAFSQATGLALQEYQRLIYGILVMYMTLSPQEILRGEGLFVNPKPSASLTPLYDRLLQHDCIQIDDLQCQAQMQSHLDNEFGLLRRYPLVRVGERQLICLDMGLLAQKLETGVFWIIRNQLGDRRKQNQFFGLWGEAFEGYVALIIQRALPDLQTQTSSMVERHIIRPKYIQKSAGECTDIAICGDETLILIECKAPVLSAEAKFSGDFSKFYAGLKDKIVGSKGVRQLWAAIQSLGHKNKKKRGKVKGIDISKVKRIYPVLILSDRIFSFIYMNWFLNLEFKRLVRLNDLKRHLEVKPLTVLTIADLERLEPYLTDTPFYTHLDRWLVKFQREEQLSFTGYLHSLGERMPRKNGCMEQQLGQIKTDILEYFSSHGIE